MGPDPEVDRGGGDKSDKERSPGRKRGLRTSGVFEAGSRDTEKRHKRKPAQWRKMKQGECMYKGAFK